MRLFRYDADWRSGCLGMAAVLIATTAVVAFLLYAWFFASTVGTPG